MHVRNHQLFVVNSQERRDYVDLCGSKDNTLRSSVYQNLEEDDHAKTKIASTNDG